jgi:hypothetical protein
MRQRAAQRDAAAGTGDDAAHLRHGSRDAERRGQQGSDLGRW